MDIRDKIFSFLVSLSTLIAGIIMVWAIFNNQIDEQMHNIFGFLGVALLILGIWATTWLFDS